MSRYLFLAKKYRDIIFFKDGRMLTLADAIRERAERLEALRLAKLNETSGKLAAAAPLLRLPPPDSSSGRRRGRPRGGYGVRGCCVPCTVRLPAEMWQELKKFAELMEISRAGLIHVLLWRELRRLRKGCLSRPSERSSPHRASGVERGGGGFPPFHSRGDKKP